MGERRSRAAALLDRDGTIIHDRDYTNDPDDVVLLDGAAEALRTLAMAGFSPIVFTNQSGIARGLVTIAQYHAVRRRLDELLASEGVRMLDTFVCPHHPEFTGPCACRKPATALYERAAAVHDLDLSRCLYIGDRGRDIAAASAFGGHAALVRSPRTDAADLALASAADRPIVDSLKSAVSLLVGPHK
ncbi:MAG: HAD family hydrolase [Gemmatimonadota bacterium]